MSNVLAVALHDAARGFEQTGEHFHGRAFTGSVRTETAEDLSWTQRERQVLDGRKGSVALGEMHGFEHGQPRQRRVPDRGACNCRARSKPGFLDTAEGQ